MSSPPAVRYSRGELDLDAVSLIVHLDSFGLDREAGGGGGGANRHGDNNKQSVMKEC